MQNLTKVRSPVTSGIIKGSKISLQVRAGTAWYQKMAKALFQFTVIHFTGMAMKKMVSGFTPTFADEEFMNKVKKHYKPSE